VDKLVDKLDPKTRETIALFSAILAGARLGWGKCSGALVSSLSVVLIGSIFGGKIPFYLLKNSAQFSAFAFNLWHNIGVAGARFAK
jgi:hypothetical protein